MLAPDHFLLTTTSANASRVHSWLEEWHQCEWPELRVAIMPVTENWATVSLAGPEARAILTKLPTDIDLSAPAFPHLALREGHLMDVPARIYRVSFTGELSYEINVPVEEGPRIWEALMTLGGPRVQPLGLDALLQLRLEKGYLHLGTDTDGTTVPDDIGWGKVAANKKRDYIGKRSLQLPENLKSDRLQFIGLAGAAGSRFIVGSHLRVRGSTNATAGWITSAGIAALSGEPIALAMLRGGRAHIGSDIDVYDSGIQTMRTRVVKPMFFDPAGDRMNA
jgi:sarcosine oxidase subunit alpha